MKISRPSFQEYLLYDETGDVCGIDDKAPDEVKEDYQKYLEANRKFRMIDPKEQKKIV